ncbi:diguanylate cyclase [Chlamydiota bacterium]
MNLDKIPREELLKIIAELEQSFYNHKQWTKQVMRTLICKLPPDNHDIGEEPHKECRFGQWYYQEVHEGLQDHPGFTSLGLEHQHMHQLASRLLKTTLRGEIITTNDFDQFANALERVALELNSLKEELEYLIYNRDPLTHAINRVNMPFILREQQELGKRQVYSCILVMMDLDHFKETNDTYGHLAGDLVLKAVVQYLTENLRPYDKVFRYGGEEFLICLPNLGVQAGFEMIERIRKGLADYKIEIGKKQSITVTASFGLTQLDPHSPIENSINQADKALLTAKSAGRNCSQIGLDTAKV